MSDTQVSNVIDFSTHAGAGTENISSEDLSIPFLRLIQNNSPEVDRANPDHAIKGIENGNAGDIFNTVTREIVAPHGEDLSVIPVGYQKSYVEWRPREDGGGMIQSHPDATVLNRCTRNEKNKYVLDNGNTVETTAYHFVLYNNNGDWERAIISMQSTQLVKSRYWLSKITSLRMTNEEGKSFNPPIFSHTYNLSAVSESNQYGSWFGWKVEIDSPVDDSAAYENAVSASRQSTLSIETTVAKELTADSDKDPY